MRVRRSQSTLLCLRDRAWARNDVQMGLMRVSEREAIDKLEEFVAAAP
jgi:hypothetical protein